MSSKYADQITFYANEPGTALHAWAENMTATGRRQATSVAASRLRQWVNRTHEDRPTRGELRAWIGMVLDERLGLHDRLAQSEGDAVLAQEAAEGLTKELDAVRAQRDEALEGYREDVERFRAHVETLDTDRTRRTRERDTAERNLHERTVEMTKAYEELRAAYDQAEGERNELARWVRVGRATCPHTVKSGAE